MSIGPCTEGGEAWMGEGFRRIGFISLAKREGESRK